MAEALRDAGRHPAGAIAHRNRGVEHLSNDRAHLSHGGSASATAKYTRNTNLASNDSFMFHYRILAVRERVVLRAVVAICCNLLQTRADYRICCNLLQTVAKRGNLQTQRPDGLAPFP